MKTALLCLLLLTSWAHAYEPPKPVPDIEILRESWHDSARKREVPVKIYLPKGAGPFPVVIFSHGLGGSRENYEYLGRWWAGCGYASVHLQHAGSDDTVWKNAPPAERGRALTASVLNVVNALNRLHDVCFVLDELARQGPPLQGRLDLSRVGMSGHSFGGWTTMAIAGQTLGPGHGTMADKRVKAAVQMSAPASALQLREHSLDPITIPLLHLTGTLDDSPIGETKAAERRKLFDGMTRAETGLIIFNGADHMTFADPLNGPRFRPSAAADHNPEFQRLICLATTAWWDAWLRENEPAKRWLTDGGLKAALGSDATLEWKHP